MPSAYGMSFVAEIKFCFVLFCSVLLNNYSKKVMFKNVRLTYPVTTINPDFDRTILALD